MIYFAYGSNMLRERLFARVGEAGQLGCAHLPGYRLTFSKRSNDGSGKCTLVSEDAGRGVWGAVFELTLKQKLALNGFEGTGYAVEDVVLSFSQKKLEAFTYVGRRYKLDHSSRPYTWYKSLVLAGAAQAGLPGHYIAAIESVSAVEDDDHGRAQVHLELVR